MTQTPDDADVPESSDRRSGVGRRVVGQCVRQTSGWQRKLLGLVLLAATVGVALQATAWFEDAPQTREPVPAVVESAPEAATRGPAFVGPTSARSSQVAEPEPVEAETPARTWKQALGAWLTKLGISAAVGLVAGVFFRTFLKTMAAITAVALAGAAVASYFGVIDFAGARADYEGVVGWVREQAEQIKDALLGVLPSAFAATAGFVAGFLRRG